MDVITISSDSETSFNEDVVKNCTSPFLRNEDTGGYSIDWNDDDVHPPIEYEVGLAEPKVRLSDKILYFKTPTKCQKTSACKDVDDEVEFIDCSFCPATTLQVPKADSLSTDSENCSQNSNSTVSSLASKARRRPKLSLEEKELAKLEKEKKKLEREKLKEKKRAEQLKQKALRAAFFDNQRNLKPEENIKFLKVHIDNEIINSGFGGNVISVLQQNNIQYVVESQRKSCTVSWSKERTEKVLDEFGGVTEKVQLKEECILLYVLNWEQAVELIHKNELLSHVETVRSAYTGKKLTLIIHGLAKYFIHKKNKRNADIRAEVNDKKKMRGKASERIFEEAHNISGDQLELALTELQLIGKLNCRCVVSYGPQQCSSLALLFSINPATRKLMETPEEFSALILNFTKSLSQIDFKMERQKRYNNDIGWVAINSSNQSVKVDKNGNGLLSLWQRQICQFSSVGLETAEAIVAHYTSPRALLSEFAKCGNERDGELLLQNIQIRRNAGLVSSSRRVGPQLSKKIFKFFTSDDPDLEL